VLCALALALTGCTGDDDPTPPTGSSSGSSAAATAASPTPNGPEPAWDQVVRYANVGLDNPDQGRLVIYPLQRVSGGLLLTIESRPPGPTGKPVMGYGHFCAGTGSCNTLGGISLVDTAGRVRYGPLQQERGGTPFTSTITQSFVEEGTTHRFGAFFADPGPVADMAVDLPMLGVVPSIPVVDGGEPLPGLAAPEGWSPGGPGDPGLVTGSLVSWPVRVPDDTAYPNRHDLRARIVGAPVTESGDVVSLNADVLFAFDKATLSGRAKQLIGRAAGLVADRADPGKPVLVTGYTDAKGGDSYNVDLSRRRAQAVRSALAGESPVKGLTLRAAGRGSQDPVAPNQVGGKDNPQGRALNRRVEITYTPKPEPAPTSAATAAASPSPAAATSTTKPAAVIGPKVVEFGPNDRPELTVEVDPVRVVGRLSVVRLTITATEQKIIVGQFGTCFVCSDLGGFRLKDAEGRVYVPAVDRDDPNRVLSSTSGRFSGGVPGTRSFVTAALPADVTEVSVVMQPIGTVKIPVER
jgi:outer membrane protein OmpA-like peptidoglycan-associated protein